MVHPFAVSPTRLSQLVAGSRILQRTCVDAIMKCVCNPGSPHEAITTTAERNFQIPRILDIFTLTIWAAGGFPRPGSGETNEALA